MAQSSLQKQKQKQKQTDEKLEQELQKRYVKQDYPAMIPLLEQLVREDHGKSRLWKYRQFYRELPSELSEASPTICYGLSLLAVLSDDTVKADSYVTLLQKQLTGYRKSSPEYKEIESKQPNSTETFTQTKNYNWNDNRLLNKTANRQILLSVSCFLVYRCKCTEYLIAPCLPKYAFFGECQGQAKPVYLSLMLHE